MPEVAFFSMKPVAKQKTICAYSEKSLMQSSAVHISETLILQPYVIYTLYYRINETIKTKVNFTAIML